MIAEFKTDHNRLSVWEAESHEDLDDAFIALASNMDNISTIFAVRLDGSSLSELEFDDKLGDTPATEANKKHHNIINLNYVSMGNIMWAILDALSNQKNDEIGMIKRTKGQLKKLLVNAYRDEKLDIDRLSPNVKKEIIKAYNQG